MRAPPLFLWFSALLLLPAACEQQSAPTPPSTPTTAEPTVDPRSAGSGQADDEKQALALFQANIKAIQDKDREAYLACYRGDADLVRASPEGVKLGFQELADGTAPTGSDEWPEKLVAADVEVHAIAPGVVYGAYKYEVTIKGETTTGLSERVFVKRPEGWRVVVTTAFQAP